MQHKNDYYTIGYIKTIYPVEENKGYKKRTFVLRNVFRKRNKWHVTDLVFVATGEAIEQLEMLYVNLEVIVNFSIKSRPWIKDGVHQQRNGKDIYFIEHNAWKIFSHTNRTAKPEVWELKDFQEVGSTNKEVENEDTQVNQEIKRRNPDNRRYDHDKYDRRSDYSPVDNGNEGETTPDPYIDDDLPF